MSCKFECLSHCLADMFRKAATGGGVSQCAARQTRSLPHQQQERSSSLQFKWSLHE